ncbi:MAG: hypothetical protein ABSC50_14890 [Candidatus Bathyarchaeia archaeon]
MTGRICHKSYGRNLAKKNRVIFGNKSQQETAGKSVSRILLIAVVLLLNVSIATCAAQERPRSSMDGRIQQAVNYLTGHFNSNVGLIYESEDAGTHWLKRVEYPNYQWKYDQTYWVYSDNLFAAYALLPWAPQIAHEINETIKRYNPPFSGKFEAVIGQPVGPDRQARDIIVNETENFAVLIRIHDGLVSDPRYHFADAMIYEALTKYYTSRIGEAQEEVRQVAAMWNGTCMVDYGVKQTELTPGNAPSDIGFCINFKLALLLYGSEVTGVTLQNFDYLADTLWKMQNNNGGITTLSTGNGEPIGSANTETTSLTLLVYNTALIARLHTTVMDETNLDRGVLLAAAITTLLPVVYLSKRKITGSRK